MKENKVNKTQNIEPKKSFDKKLKNYWNNMFKNMSSIRSILIWYIVISFMGAFFLWAPFSHKEAIQNVSFIDALFVSSSAFSDTGLTTLGISETFNWFGQFVTLILLNIGGVGWFTIKMFFFTFILKKTTRYNDINYSTSELGTSTKSDTLGLIFMAVTISLSSSIIFGLIFGLIFYFTGIEGIDGFGSALWIGVYHASASVNNSGLDIFIGDTSMMNLYGEKHNIPAEIIIEILTMSLFILGGIGFGIFYDVHKWKTSRKTGTTFSFSLVTKLSVVIYFSVSLVGLGLVYLTEGFAVLGESSNAFLSPDFSEESYLSDTSVSFRLWMLTFNTFSTRNAGFTVLNIKSLQDSTLLIQSLMMFIGSGPGSTAGGLRTTTFGVLLISVWALIRNKKQPTAFNRSIPKHVTDEAIAILFASIALVFIDIILICTIESTVKESELTFMDNLFVVFSAYGTTGLSSAPLANYHFLSKLILITLMFIGQMGMATTLLQAKTKQINYQKTYVEEEINLG